MHDKSTNITDRERGQIYDKFYTGSEFSTHDEALLEPSVYAPIKEFYRQAVLESQPFNQLYTQSHSRASASSFPEAYAVPETATYAETDPKVIHQHHHHDSGIPWWVFLLMNRNSGSTYNLASQQREERRESNFAAYAGILIIAGVVILPALGGSFYLLSELWNNFERLYYNEGYLQAGLGMINIVASLSLSAVLTNAVLSSAITALAVSAGFANPVSWAFFILSCVTLFVAAVLHLAFQEGIYRMTAAFNQDALHPEEPGRFSISDAQVADIRRRNKQDKSLKELDTNKMQNVITAIHHDIVQDPSTTQRLVRYSPFFRSADTAEKLAAIRRLRMEGTVNYETELGDGSETAISFNSMSLRTTR